MASEAKLHGDAETAVIHDSSAMPNSAVGRVVNLYLALLHTHVLAFAFQHFVLWIATNEHAAPMLLTTEAADLQSTIASPMWTSTIETSGIVLPPALVTDRVFPAASIHVAHTDLAFFL